jgi:hypothetical protein
MADLTDQDIISSILEKTGIIENKSLLVEIIEDEVKLEMMERFDVVEIKPTNDNDPLTYGLDASTYFDLYCASRIQPRFYKTITSAQRSFIRQLTANDSFFFDVTRTDDFVQLWEINLELSESAAENYQVKHLSFTIEIGIRDPYPMVVR